MRSSMSIMDSKDLNVIGKPLTRDSSNIKMLGDIWVPKTLSSGTPLYGHPTKNVVWKEWQNAHLEYGLLLLPVIIGPDFIEKSYQSHFLGSLCEILM